MVKAPDCNPGIRRFDSDLSFQSKEINMDAFKKHQVKADSGCCCVDCRVHLLKSKNRRQARRRLKDQDRRESMRDGSDGSSGGF